MHCCAACLLIAGLDATVSNCWHKMSQHEDRHVHKNERGAGSSQGHASSTAPDAKDM